MNKFQRRVNFFDADPAGIMFFGKIFEFCHSAYEEWVAGFNLSEDYFNHPLYAIPLIHTEADFFKPIKPGETITIEIEIEKIGTNSFTLNYNILNNNRLKTVIVKTAHVFVKKENFTKCPIPEEFLGKLNLYIKLK